MKKNIHHLVREKNQRLNQWEQYYRIENIQSYPIRIQFPTGSRCNLFCRFCTERKGESAKDYNYEDMDYEEFLAIARDNGWRQALSSANDIALYGWGEPLVNPDYEKIFDFVKENLPGLGIDMSTNGILFNKAWAKKVTEMDHANINFSINAATRKTYRSLMGMDQFDRVIANLSYLTALRKETGTKRLRVCVSFVATTENIKELPHFVDLAANLDVDCIFVRDVMMLTEEIKKFSLTNKPLLAALVGKIANERAKKRNIAINFELYENHQQYYFPVDEGFLPFWESMVKPWKYLQPPGSITPPSPYEKATDCFSPWESFMLRKNGDVFPCCESQGISEFTLGNIYRQKFDDIWNGEAYRGLRQTVNTDNPPAVCAACPKKAGVY